MANQDDERDVTEVPESYVWTQKFPSGIVASCTCSFGAYESRRYRVHCEQGWFELENAFSYRGQELTIKDARGVQKLQITPKNHFTEEMDHFSMCIQENKNPLTPGEEGLADMKIIAMLEASATQGKTIPA